jgi:ABC-type uncharacterized transport system substrate-binding protein
MAVFAVLFLFFPVFAGAPAAASHVVIVRASDAEPYAQAEAAIRTRLMEGHHEARGLLLKDVAEKGIAAMIGTADLVVGVGTPAARWLHKQLPANIKLVYCMVSSAEEAGLLTPPDCWGVTTEVALAEQVQLMAQALPRARNIGMLYRSDLPDGRRTFEAIKAAIPPDWRMEGMAVNEYPSIAAAIDALIQKNVDVIWTNADQKVYDTNAVRALLLAGLRTRTPVWGFSPAFVRAGALVGVGVEPRAQGTQVADVALKVMAGQASPKEKAQAPVEFQVAVNLIVASKIGVEIPGALTRRAAYVFRPEN